MSLSSLGRVLKQKKVVSGAQTQERRSGRVVMEWYYWGRVLVLSNEEKI